MEDEEKMNTKETPEGSPKPGILDRIVTIVLLAICLLMAYLVAKPLIGKVSGNDAETKGPAKTTEAVVNVSTYTVEPATFVRTSTMGAQLEGSMDAHNLYSTEVAGTLTALDLSVGQTIQAGQVIGTVDPSTPGEVYKPTAIKATIGGTVYTVDSYVGQRITTGTSLATVGSSGELEVVAHVAERYLSTLEEGMQATFTASAWPDERFAATIKTISPTVNTTNRTVEVTLSIDKPDARLKEGMYVSLRLTIDQVDGALTIPSTALTTYLGEYVVYVADGENARRVPVTLGSANDTQTVITSGLKAGDQVITAGNVTEGTRISVVK